MKRLLWLVGVSLFAVGCGPTGFDEASAPDSLSQASSELRTRGTLRVMTQNLYIGTDITQILGGGTGPEQIPAFVAEAFAEVQATNFPERAQQIADEIEAELPHVIGLQEVELIRTQFPGDFLLGNPVPATTVAYDYLDILLAALQDRGLDYRPVAVTVNADIELPSATGADFRLTDRDVLLVRGDVPCFDPEERNFAVNLAVPAGPLGTLEITRGWVAASCTVQGQTFRFVNTHLEPGPTPLLEQVQLAQAAELIAALAPVQLPVVLLGDFNSAPEGTPTQTYALLAASGYLDAWALARPGAPGYTCCQAEDLLNHQSLLSERIDLILLRNVELFPGGVKAERVGEQQSDKTPSGLWPSDHAGVVASIVLSRGRELITTR